MIIVNREKFIVLPPGTLYSRYKPCIISGLEIKGKSVIFPRAMGDWFYQDILGETGSCDNFVTSCEKMEAGENVALDLNIEQRDGGFIPDEMFLIYSSEDIKTIVTEIAGEHYV